MPKADAPWPQRVGRNSPTAILVAAIVIGVVTRIASLPRLLEFTPDQARDGLRVLAIWAGQIPTLGQEVTSVWLGPERRYEYGFHVLPLGYFLVVPFTLAGPDPRWQVVPCALLSFLSILLATLLAYRLLTNVATHRRRLLASLGGLWWSLFAADIVLAAKEWNPSPIPCLFFATVLLYEAAFRARSSWPRSALLWGLYGGVAALLASLHGSTLAVIPPVFFASCVAYCIRYRAEPQRFAFPALALAAALAVATPYWIGEAHRGWTNTREILALAVSRPPDAPRLTLRARGVEAVSAYSRLASQAYFPVRGPARYVGIPFMLAVLAGAFAFRGDRLIGAYLAGTWLVFEVAAAAAGPRGTEALHDRLLLVVAPLLLGLCVFAYVRSATPAARLLRLVIGSGLALSLLFNARLVVNLEGERFGPHRVMSTSDLANAFRSLPRGAEVCINPAETWTPALYIDRLITHRGLHFVSPCLAGTYVVRPRFVGDAMGDLLSFGPGSENYATVANPDSVSGLRVVVASGPVDIYRVEPGRRYVLVQGFPHGNMPCFERTAPRELQASVPGGWFRRQRAMGAIAADLLAQLVPDCF